MSPLPKFKLANYFSKHQFVIKHMLSLSDAELFTQTEVLDKADEECKELWENLSLAYTVPQGPLLLKEIAAQYDLKPENVLTVVPQEGLYIGIMTVLEFLRK